MNEIIKDSVRAIRQMFFRWEVSKCDRYLLNSNPILVIAPHPDDETFGCAGLIAKKVQEGASVSVLFLTSGENSLKDVSNGEVMSHRQASAQKVAKLLGVKNIYFMDFTDGKIPRFNDTDFSVSAEKVASHIQSIAPKELFCTHISEGWSDHTAAAELSKEALKFLHQDIVLYYYWVWVWFSVPLKNISVLDFSNTCYLSIKDVKQQKKEAVNLYLDNIDKKGRAYCGKLPKMFLKAFEWPYEVFEKVEYK